LAFDDAVEFGVNTGELLVVEFDRGAEFADFAVDLIDFVLEFPDLSAALEAQAADFVLQAQSLIREFTATAVAEAFGDGLIELGDGQRLRLNFTRRAAMRAAVEKFFDLIPTGDEEEKAAEPGGDFKGGGGHGAKGKKLKG
jgi:hypothetical protein